MATKTTMDRDVAGILVSVGKIEQQITTLTPMIQTMHDHLEGDKGLIAWRETVDNERKTGKAILGALGVAMMGLLFNSCSLHPNVSPLITPEPPIVSTPVPTDTPTPTAEPTPAPEPPATDTPEPSCTQTPDWAATPTMITPTGSIIEVTPLGGERKVTGTYTTLNNQRSRACPGIECDVVRTISAGQTLRFYDWRSWLPLEAWVCISVSCGEWMASTYKSKEMGVITFDE